MFAIECAQEKDLEPKQFLAGSLYGSNENVQTATARGVEVISPPMGSEKEGNIGLSDFATDKFGKIISLSLGPCPLHVKKKKSRCWAAFMQAL